MDELIAELKHIGVLRSLPIKKALAAVDRAGFVPENVRAHAYEDTALPIGFGQTISQPYTVVYMLERLQVRRGDRVLEVGYGSCWATALLAELVGAEGRVYAFEIVPELCAFGKQNLAKYPELARRVELLCENAEDGYAAKAPFDRIIAAAALPDVPTSEGEEVLRSAGPNVPTDESEEVLRAAEPNVPEAWRKQLAPRGRMVYPKGNSLFLETKKADGTFSIQEFPGFTFVSFRRKNGR